MEPEAQSAPPAYPPLFIEDDGYTLPGYLEGEPGLFPPLRFTYRPPLPAVRLAWWDFEERENAKADAAAASAAKSRRKVEIILAQVRSWEACDRQGRSVPLNAAWVTKMHPTQHDRLFNVALAVAAPAPDPQRPAAVDTREPGERDRADAKN
jgi:hypothetical protein